MEAKLLPTKRKFSWKVFLIVLALAFGWLYWTYGLESAMLTHLTVDAQLYVVLPLAM